MRIKYSLLLISSTFSGWYATKLPLSPVYFFSAISIIAFTLYCVANNIVLRRPDWIVVVAVMCITPVLVIIQINSEGLISQALSISMGFVLYIIVKTLVNYKIQYLRPISKIYIYATLIIATAEAIFRLLNPDYTGVLKAEELNQDPESIFFYAFKINSFMYMDSNFIGLQLALLLSFMLALHLSNIKLNTYYYIAVLILIALSLSRASIVTAAAIIIIFMLLRASLTRQIIIILAAIPFVIYGYSIISDDASFQTKFHLIDLLINHVASTSAYDLLFGVGIGNAVDHIGMGAHNIGSTYIIELGLIVSALIFIFWMYSALSHKGGSLLIAALLINGLSLTALAIPYFYVQLALLPRKSLGKDNW